MLTGNQMQVVLASERARDAMIKAEHEKRLAEEAAKPYDPIHQDSEGWWFWDETQTSQYGPYPSREAATAGMKRYAEQLEQDRRVIQLREK